MMQDAINAGDVDEIVEDLLKVCSGPLDTTIYSWQQLEPVWKTVEKLNIIQKDAKCPTLLSQPRDPQGFLKWLEDNNVKVDDFEVSESDDMGLGLKTTRCFNEDENAIVIPRNLSMSTEAADATSLSYFFSSNKNLFLEVPSLKLCIYLLSCANDHDSFYAPYIRMLPRKFNMPLYFSRNAMEAMKVSAASEMTMRLFRTIVRQYAVIYKLLKQSKKLIKANSQCFAFSKSFTWDSWRWAVSCVMSRQNKTPTRDGSSEDPCVLIPLWDLANHSSGSSKGRVTTYFSMESDSVVCCAMQDIGKGEPFEIYYGNRSNCNFLVYQGFVVEENRFDQVELRLGLSPSDPLHRTKAQILYEMGIVAASRYLITRDKEVPFTPDFLAFVRVFCLDKNELGMFLLKKQEAIGSRHLTHLMSAVSPTHELKVWNFISMRCMLLSTQNDKKLKDLQSKDIDEGEKLVSQLLTAEKKVYKYLMDFSNRMKSTVTAHRDGFLFLYPDN